MNMTLTEQEINIILTALSQRPYCEVSDLIFKIAKSVQEQGQRDTSN